jgi:hypothetical protein
VTVSIQRDRDGGVPEHLGDDLRVYALRQQQRGAGVPEVVEADLRQPGPPKQGFPVPVVQVVAVRGVAPRVGEDEAMFST